MNSPFSNKSLSVSFDTDGTEAWMNILERLPALLKSKEEIQYRDQCECLCIDWSSRCQYGYPTYFIGGFKMRIRPAYLAIFFLWLAAISNNSISPASAQEAFFQGKTIRIIVGFSAGGGFDVYSRTTARHMGKHIAGSPSVLVENMPGA